MPCQSSTPLLLWHQSPEHGCAKWPQALLIMALVPHIHPAPLGWTWWSLSSPHTECLHRGQVITSNGPGPPEYHLGAPKTKIGKKRNEMLGKAQGIGIAAQGGWERKEFSCSAARVQEVVLTLSPKQRATPFFMSSNMEASKQTTGFTQAKWQLKLV